MTDLAILNWLILSVSLFNTIVLAWLGLTVWFAADRDRLARVENRRWGVWIISAGSLIGALFFTSHTVLLGFSLDGDLANAGIWIQAAAVPVVAIPFLWYAVVLWYAGFGEPDSTALRRRHGLWFRAALLTGVVLAAWTFLPGALPAYAEILMLSLGAYLQPDRGGVLVPGVLVYILACSALSLDALGNPGKTTRLMGAQARRRARPWLAATAALLVAASLGVLLAAAVSTGAVLERTHVAAASPRALLGWFDLTLSMLIAAGVVALGQAVVAYEVFTGRSLPRRGFRQQWRRVLILAGGYGLVVGGALAAGARPVVTLLLTTLIMTVFFALLSSRSFRERELTIAQLRPFVSTGGVGDRFITDEEEGERQAEEAFHALCETVLEAQAAYLLPAGSLAQIVPQDLRSPPHLPPYPQPAPVDLFAGPDDLVRPVDDGQKPAWAVSLWGERGLTGVLVLEEKRGGGLYTLEEIEIARTFCERLLGLRANAALTRRLLGLQRERLAESQVLDRQARRILHDDILPKVHTAVLALGQGGEEARRQLTEVHREISDLLRGAAPVRRPDLTEKGVTAALEEVVARELAGSFDEVNWDVAPETGPAFARLSALQREVVYYAARESLRNAAQHGREAPGERLSVWIRAGVAEGRLVLSVRDDGRGIAEEGPSSGSGQGLALHRTLLEILGGELVVESEPGAFTEVRWILPVGKL